MLYWNNPSSSISNLVLYPRSSFGGKIIFVLGLIWFNQESTESIFLQDADAPRTQPARRSGPPATPGNVGTLGTSAWIACYGASAWIAYVDASVRTAPASWRWLREGPLEALLHRDAQSARKFLASPGAARRVQNWGEVSGERGGVGGRGGIKRRTRKGQHG